MNIEDIVVISNDRDRRTILWLKELYEDDILIEALGDLVGKRKSYVSNLCKILNVTPPDNLRLTSRDAALSKGIPALRDALRKQ